MQDTIKSINERVAAAHDDIIAFLPRNRCDP